MQFQPLGKAGVLGVCMMGCHTEMSNKSIDQTLLAASQKTGALQTRHGVKLRDMLMLDRPNLSYADFHHEITRDVDNVPPRFLGNPQNRGIERRDTKEDELVRYMSKLPSYLEKGKHPQEKALNVGVLDWGRLEKWRHNNKQMPVRSSGYSSSSCSTSNFSTDGSSTHSSIGQSCSPAPQRMHRFSVESRLDALPKEVDIHDAKLTPERGHSCSPARQRSHLPGLQSYSSKAYPWESKSQKVHVSRGDSRKFQDANSFTCNGLDRQQKVVGGLDRQQKVVGGPGVHQKKETGLKSTSDVAKQHILDGNEVEAAWKGKMKTKDKESITQEVRLRDTNSRISDQDHSETPETVVLILPRDSSKNALSGGYASQGQLSMEPKPGSISEKGNFKSTYGSNIHCSEPLLHKYDDVKYSEKSGCCSSGVQNVKNPPRSSKFGNSPSQSTRLVSKGSSQQSRVLMYSAKVPNGTSKSKNMEDEKKPVYIPKILHGVNSFGGSDSAAASEPAPKVRHPSPIRRLSNAMGRMIRSAGSRDSSPVPNRSSKENASKPGSGGASVSLSTNNPSSDKLLANNRSRSSPLRRLLDPLLKPKAPNCTDQPKKSLMPTMVTSKSSHEPVGFSGGQPETFRSKLHGSRTSAAVALDQNSKHGSPMLQALLQVAFKNGLPLLTFAIDNKSNILAATVRNSSSQDKRHCSWVCTFFNIREIKKRNGSWLNQGGKSDGHGYVSNVVAQMKPSDFRASSGIGHEYMDDYSIREFNLFAVDVAEADQRAADFHPTNELAAIVIKIPRSTTRNPSKDGQPSTNYFDPSHSCFREDLHERRRHPGEDFLSTTVILPGGVHTVPSKGEISSLAHRWRSGGSCDCGGWDLGCQLRIYSNRGEGRRKLSSSEARPSDEKFQLFPQIGQENQPVLSLSPYKDRIYSVEFHPSLSLLQAFAASVAFLDCKKPGGLFEELTRAKILIHQGEAPASYVSYPPHSPVGRV